jgi:putative component of toxin-antitoxin plasmid stabilization module
MRIMNTIVRTDIFDTWLSGLKDAQVKARIIKRIRSAERGNQKDITRAKELAQLLKEV